MISEYMKYLAYHLRYAYEVEKLYKGTPEMVDVKPGRWISEEVGKVLEILEKR